MNWAEASLGEAASLQEHKRFAIDALQAIDADVCSELGGRDFEVGRAEDSFYASLPMPKSNRLSLCGALVL